MAWSKTGVCVKGKSSHQHKWIAVEWNYFEPVSAEAGIVRNIHTKQDERFFNPAMPASKVVTKLYCPDCKEVQEVKL